MEEENKKQVKQVKMDLELPLSTKQILLVCGGMVVSTVIGFTVGFKYNEMLICRGIAKCWLEDPTLKEHMWKVANSVNEKLK